MNFDEDVSSVTVSVDHFYSDDGFFDNAEEGTYALYQDGQQVGEGTFVADSETGEMTFSIESDTPFDQVVFGAIKL